MEDSKATAKELMSPTKTSPMIIRVSPQSKIKATEELSSKGCKINMSVKALESEKDYIHRAKKSLKDFKATLTNLTEPSQTLIISNCEVFNVVSNSDLVKSSDTKSQENSKDEEAISVRGQIPVTVKQDREESKECNQSTAINAKVCPFKVSTKRKLSHIVTPDAIPLNSSNQAQMVKTPSGSFESFIEDKGLSKLEAIKEALRQQLNDQLFNSSDEESGKSPQTPNTQLGRESSSSKVSGDSYAIVDKSCSAGTETVAELQSTSEKCHVALEGEMQPGLPPLVMQSSNLLFNDELDNGHGGGGLETTHEGETEEPLSKKIKLSNENDQEGFGENAINADSVDSDLAEKDDVASTSTIDPLNSEQNGVMEFDILDEFESDDNEPNDEDPNDSENSDISTDEIDAMLEKGFEDRNKELEHEEKQKVILKVLGRDHFDVLPEGWIEVTHNSGMPIYLHKQTRVCSVSKPYFLGPGSTRKHEIPVSAIPCLHYLKELEKENSTSNIQEQNCETEPEKPPDPSETSNNVNGESEKPQIVLKSVSSDKPNPNVTNSTIPSAKLESVKEIKESGSLNYLAVREYCQKRFEFQTITVKRFRTWSGRRKHQKQLKRKQRPYLPDSTKLITCPLLASSDKTSSGNNNKKEFIMNPSGKSPVCILHEYVQHTLRAQPKYIFKELETASTPYGAVVMIDDVEYGCGYGSSKKLAKSEAAKSALEILIPKLKMFSKEEQSEECQDVDFFDQVRVEDPRVCELSVKAGQPYPYQILLECLKRNYGMGDTEIEFSMNSLKHQKNEFFMKVGKHEVSVVCKNKRDGKHRASQAVLQRLHPHIKSWGSLLRMYGKGSCKTLKEKKEEEQRITELQSKACVNKPNMSILNKLKEEMLKYREKMMKKKPIGKLIPEKMEFFSTSNSNLNNVEL